MSWERYGCQKDCTDFPDGCIDANLFSSMAQAMVDKVHVRCTGNPGLRCRPFMQACRRVLPCADVL